MSQLSRILSLGSRLCCRRSYIAAHVRPARLIQLPPLRYAARIASQSREERPRRTVHDDAMQLKESLRMLNEQVQRTGRIVSKSVDETIALAERIGSISGVETQLLLRATGSFLKDRRPSEREKLTDRVWSLTPKDRLDISHYNTLLHVKLENGAEFDPSSFLQELSDAQIAPNRVTFQRFIQRYCEMGDIENATKIIEHMKSQDLPITEKVFHSLIIGHLRSGNQKGALDILDAMQSADLRPSGETYTVLAAGLAEAGDSQGALEILTKQPLLDEQTLRIVKALAVRDDIEAVEKAMERLSDATINYSNVNSICIELIVMGKIDMAVDIFKKSRGNSLRKDAANFMVLQAARSGYSASETWRICEALKDLGVEEHVFIEATQVVVQSGNKALSGEYIQKMKDLGLPMRAHYFLPFLCAAQGEHEVFEELERIKSLEQPTCELLEDFVLPRVDIDDWRKIHDRLTRTGLPSGLVADALVRHLIKENRLEDAEKLLLESQPSKTAGIPSLAAKAMCRTDNVPTAIRILERISEHGDPRHEMMARFIEHSGHLVNQAVDALSRTNLRISLKSFNRLQSAGINVAPLSNQVVNVQESSWDERFMYNRSTEELEALAAEAEATGQNATPLLKRLLADACKNQRKDVVEEILRKLPESSLGAANLSQLIEFFIKEQDAERAAYFFEQSLQRNFILNPFRVLSLARLLVDQKRLFEASELLEKASSNFSIGAENFQIESSAGTLLLSIFNAYGKDACMNFYERYISKHVSARPLGIPLKNLLETDTVEGFEFFKEIVLKYGQTPCRKYLLHKLIEENRTEELGVMEEILERLFGRTDCAIDFAVVYLEHGKVQEARDMLLRCDGRRTRNNLMRVCNMYFSGDQMDNLNVLLRLLEDLKLEKDLTALFRIKQYSRENNVAAALETWTQSQEDNTVLQSATLEILAELLERNGEPVPFIIPSEAGDFGTGKAYRRPQSSTPNSEKTRMIEDLISKNMIKEALDEAKNMIDSIRDDTRDNIRSSPWLSKTGRRVIGDLIDAAFEKGLIEELETFIEASNTGHMQLQRAYRAAGRLDEYLTKLESKPLDGFDLPILPESLDSDPEIFARFESLARRQAKEANRYAAIADFWFVRLLNGEQEKAIELQEEFPQLLTHAGEKGRHPAALASFDQSFFERLVQTTERREVRSRALFLTLLALTRKGRIEEAKSCLSYGVAIGLETSTIPRFLMADLENPDSGSGFASSDQSHQEVRLS